MEFTGVYHRTSEQMSYALDKDRLIINLKTGYDVKQVFIHYGDPFEAGILGGSEKWTGKEKKQYTKNDYQISCGGLQLLLRYIKDVSISLNCIHMTVSGITLKTDF